MVEDLIAEPQHVAHLYNELQKRKRSLIGTSEAVPEAEVLGESGRLTRIDSDFKLAWVDEHSDLTEKDCIELMKADGQSIHYLLQMGLQSGFKLKLPASLRVREVMKRFFDERAELARHRLKDIKKNKGVKADWTIDFLKVGVFALAWGEDGLLTTITHRPTGDTASVPPEARVTKQYKLVDNFDDLNAHMLLKPLPPLHLSAFFGSKEKKGPFAMPSYIGRHSALAADAQATLGAWGRDAVASKGRGSAAAIQELAEHNQGKQSEHTATARAQARAVLKNKKARRSIVIE